MTRSPRRQAAGFTLVELMISLVIIGIMAMAVAPSLTELLADNRQNSAAWDIVRLARRARGMATARGVAHLLLIRNTPNADGANGLGAILVYAGMNNKCAQTPWGPIFTAPNAFNPVERFTMFPYNPARDDAPANVNDIDRQVIHFEVRIGGNENDAAHTAGVQICYQPNGEIYSSLSSAAGGTLLPQGAPVLLSVRRKMDTRQLGVAGGRQVLFPTGGNARLR
jgi:prepilin-type N-terminal cleavage/methylation domain-containing protein